MAANQIIATTTTSSGGGYSFSGLIAGSYTVQVVQQSGYDPSSASSVTINVTSGLNDSSLNFGEFQTVTLGGEVYDDLNDNGQLDAGEPGIAGWTVNLLNSASQVVASMATDSNGDYSFPGVGPGSNTIAEVLQTGYVQTAPASGGFAITTTSGTNVVADDFGIAQGALLSVSGLAITPSTGLQSGTSLVVSWNDVNAGNSPIGISFTDLVTITNTTTNQVLGTIPVAYDVGTRGTLGAGQSAAQQAAFRLPDGDPGVGQIQFTVTADYENTVTSSPGRPNQTASLTVRLDARPVS